jgi:Raf kinase inhibitor-like YbhB/YbcL family protein
MFWTNSPNVSPGAHTTFVETNGKMNKIFFILAILCTTAASAQTFTLKSNDMGGQISNKQYANFMGFTGENQSPELSWENAPAGTQAFAVTIYDLDAPTGSGFWHWVVYNIPADVKEIKSGAGDVTKNLLPAGAIQGNTDMGKPGYVGPAPTPGPAHQYLVTVYALKNKLTLDKNATAAYIGFNLSFNTIAKASIVAYGQK